MHCLPQPKVGLWRRKLYLHAHSRESANDCRRQQVNCASLLPSLKTFVSWLSYWERHWPSSSKHAGLDTQMGLKICPQSCILFCRFQFPASSFWVGGSFKAFVNALNNFASWVDIFISALEGMHAIQNSGLKELIKQRGVNVCTHASHCSNPWMTKHFP